MKTQLDLLITEGLFRVALAKARKWTNIKAGRYPDSDNRTVYRGTPPGGLETEVLIPDPLYYILFPDEKEG